ARAPPPQHPATWVRPATAGQAGDAARSEGDTPPGGIPIPPREVYTLRGAAAALGRGAARLAVEAARLAREYPLESASVTLLAIGGVIPPLPHWLFWGPLGGGIAGPAAGLGCPPQGGGGGGAPPFLRVGPGGGAPA